MSSTVLNTMKEQVAAYKVAGAGTIHFTPSGPLPEEIIEAIVAARVKENIAGRGIS